MAEDNGLSHEGALSELKRVWDMLHVERKTGADLRQQLAEAKERLQELYDQANIYGANPPRMMPTRIVIRTAGSILYPATGKGDPDGRVEGN